MADPFDLVIFDCDGVVVDSEVLACTCLRQTLADYGVPATMEDIFEKFLGRSFAAVADYYERSVGSPLPGTFTVDNANRLAAVFSSSLKAIPHVQELLATLDRPYCLASSSDDKRIALALSVTGLDGLFATRIFHAGMVTRGKPAPDLFLHAAGRMNASPARTVVVEDTVSGVRAGKAAGMTVWGFIGGSHCAGRDVGGMLAAAGADKVFDSMADFPALET